MQIGFEQALKVYEQFNNTEKCPSHHPFYLLLDAKRNPELQPTFFVYEQNGEVFFNSFHMSRVPDSEYFDLQSPYGYGGPIATTGDEAFLKCAWTEYEKWCRQNGVLAEFVRFHPILGNWRYYGGEVIHDRSTVWIDLTKEDLMSSYQSRVRNMVRKAKKSDLRIEWTDATEFFRWFPKLYEDLMVSIGADDFYLFSNDYYNSWESVMGTSFCLCKLNDDVIGASIFFDNEFMMEYHLSASNEIAKKLAGTTLMIHEAALRAKERGCQKLHLGGGTNGSPDNPLLYFKSGFSAEKADYRIGKYIHMPEEYQNLKNEWEQKTGHTSNRVLFYR